MKCKIKGVKGEIALKIDISKAFDRVDWGFLRAMMAKLGFNDRWIEWIMLCVSSVNYLGLVNSDLVGPIYCSRQRSQAG